jgi:pimeloyl-ACP methyl ester carboxylesterase
MNPVLKKYEKIYQYHKAEEPTSKTLVCLAGVSEGCYRFYEYLAEFTKDFNVVLFNNPGVDGAPEEMFFSVEDLAERFQHVLNLLNIDSYYLLGHSMGGFIAQRMALSNPNKINKLVLFGTSFGSFNSEDDLKSILDTKNTLKNAIGNLKEDKSFIQMQNYSFTKQFQKQNPEVIAKYLDEKLVKYKIKKQVLASHFMCGGRFSSFNETQNITTPTLIIHGTADRMVNIKGGISLAKTIPNSQFLQLEGQGHNPFIENPKVMKKVSDFMLKNKKIGEVLPKDYLITQSLIEQDNDFRTSWLKKASKNLFKELFMIEDIEKAFKNIYNASKT